MPDKSWSSGAEAEVEVDSFINSCNTVFATSNSYNLWESFCHSEIHEITGRVRIVMNIITPKLPNNNERPMTNLMAFNGVQWIVTIFQPCKRNVDSHFQIGTVASQH